MAQKLLDRQKLEAAYVGFSTRFNMVLEMTPVIFPQIATVIEVDEVVTTYNWLGENPVMKKWLGQRTVEKLRAEKHTIETEPYANGIEVDRNDIRDDKLGLVVPRINRLAAMSPRHMDKLVIESYINGFSATGGTCYDGQFLFDTDHTASGSGGTSQSNLQTGALSDTTYDQAWQKFGGFVMDNGEPIEISPDTLMCGYSNRKVARKILEQELKETATGMESNIERGTARLIVNSRITGSHWFLLATMVEVRAVILQIRQQAQFAAQDDMNSSDNAFMNRTFRYGADHDIGVGYGLWQTAVGSTG